MRLPQASKFRPDLRHITAILSALQSFVTETAQCDLAHLVTRRALEPRGLMGHTSRGSFIFPALLD
jgi:hypothetical protein